MAETILPFEQDAIDAQKKKEKEDKKKKDAVLAVDDSIDIEEQVRQAHKIREEYESQNPGFAENQKKLEDLELKKLQQIDFDKFKEEQKSNYTISKTDGSESENKSKEEMWALFDNKDFLESVTNGTTTYQIENDEALVNQAKTKLDTHDYLENKGHLWPTSYFSRDTLPDGRRVTSTDEWKRWTIDNLQYYNDEEWVGEFIDAGALIPHIALADPNKTIWEKAQHVAFASTGIWGMFFGGEKGKVKIKKTKEGFSDLIIWTGRHIFGSDALLNSMDEEQIKAKYKLPEDFVFPTYEDIVGDNIHGDEIVLSGEIGEGYRKHDDTKINTVRQERIDANNTFHDTDLPSYSEGYSFGIDNLEDVISSKYQSYYNAVFEQAGIEPFITFEPARGGRDHMRIKIGNQRIGTVVRLNIQDRFNSPLDPLALKNIELIIKMELNPEMKKAWIERQTEIYSNNPELLDKAGEGRNDVNYSAWIWKMNEYQGIDHGINPDGSGPGMIR